MNRRFLSISGIGLLFVSSACQRTYYASFNKSTVQPIECPVKATSVAVLDVPERRVTPFQIGKPSDAQALPGAVVAEASARTFRWIPATSARQPTQSLIDREGRPTDSFLTKQVARRIEKINHKQLPQGSTLSANRMGLLSTIFGTMGLVLIWFGFIPALVGMFLGLLGYLLGLISIGRISRKKKVFSILGIVFGGLALLLALYVLIV